jgi:hypothetical protein
MNNELEKILKYAQYEIDLGMKIEVKEILDDMISIENHNIKIKENTYVIDIKLKEFSFEVAKQSFDYFMNFIRFEYYNLYISKRKSNGYYVKYYTLYKDNAGLNGACFEINYS